jgi:hypothetical protein
MSRASTAFSRAISSKRAGKFFELVDRAVALRMMARPRRELAIAHGAQFAAHGRFGRGEAELVEQPLAKVDDPPAHDAMDRRRRAGLDDARERGAMLVLQKRRLPRHLAIDKAIRAVNVEAKNPVANDLKRHAADLRRLAACRPVVNRRKGEEPSGLWPVLRTSRHRA